MYSYNSLVWSCFQTTSCYCSDVFRGNRKYGGSHVQPKKFNLVPEKLNLMQRKINSVPKIIKFNAEKFFLVPKKINLVLKKLKI